VAARKPKGTQPPKPARSLREQVKELSHLAVPSPAPLPPARPKPPAPRGDELTFEQLAARILPGARPTVSAAVAAGAAPAPSREPRPRLWVERSESTVRARAEDAPERLVQDLERGRMVPRRELDLHRQSAATARQILDTEIPRARKDGISCLLVVCGRGMHSTPEGPVLPDVVIERLSEELEADVLAFTTAPRRWGGQGAFIVCLRAAAGV